MKFEKVAIDSLTYELSQEQWSSELIEEKLKTLYDRLSLPQGRLELMTGIKSRHFWEESMRPSQSAALAGKKALAAAETKKEEIDLLIYCGVLRDCLEPSTAAYVHGLLGLGGHVQILDVSNACLGFLNAMTLAGGMIDRGVVRSALLVTGENGRGLVENTINRLNQGDLDRNAIKPYFANLTIGAGAAAMVLARSDNLKARKPALLFGSVMTDSGANTLCEGSQDLGSLEMQTDSEALLEAGINLAKQTWERFEGVSGWTKDTPERFICHQVGSRHRNKLYNDLELDVERDFSTFEHLGNMGSASVPVTLAQAVEQEAVQADDLVALMGIGSGLSSLILGVHW